MTNYLELLRWHNRRDCPYPKCKKVFEDGVVLTKVENDEIVEWSPNGHFLFHYYDAHGIPAEVITEKLTEMINSEMSQAEVNTYNKIIKNKIESEIK